MGHQNHSLRFSIATRLVFIFSFLPTLIGQEPEGTKQARYTFGPISALRPQDE